MLPVLTLPHSYHNTDLTTILTKLCSHLGCWQSQAMTVDPLASRPEIPTTSTTNSQHHTMHYRTVRGTVRRMSLL